MSDERSLAERHQAHYRHCGCLGDAAECCDERCICHVPELVTLDRIFNGE